MTKICAKIDAKSKVDWREVLKKAQALDGNCLSETVGLYADLCDGRLLNVVYNRLAMMDWNTNIVAPLTVTDDGTIRITGTRVSLDSIIHHFKLGATAEEIVYKFPSLRLADVYAVIAYYLNKREEVEKYLQQQEADAEIIQQRIEAVPDYQTKKSELRQRLLA